MQRTTLSPAECAALVHELRETRNPNVWVYRYRHPSEPWVLAIATHAPPQSGKLSLGGFRIAPLGRVITPGFSAEHEAIALAIGMEEKVHWSRVIGVGGPLAIRDLTRVVGGKCVLVPTDDARVGNPRDIELLTWASECLNDCEAHAGVHITTGQDLGHGLLSDGSGSLEFLHARFAGSVVADTSVPTGEGNYQILNGMLRAFGVPLERATVGLIGCGNIGMHIIERLREHRGVRLLACEAREQRRAELEAMGIPTWGPEDKADFLALAMDALVVNANGGTLDGGAIGICAANRGLKVVCGSENLVMPDHTAGTEALRAAHKVYAPTELGGMMGYLTAVEEYLATLEGLRFDVQTVLDAAVRLETAGYEATGRIIAGAHAETFEEAVTALYL